MSKAISDLIKQWYPRGLSDEVHKVYMDTLVNIEWYVGPYEEEVTPEIRMEILLMGETKAIWSHESEEQVEVGYVNGKYYKLN